MNLSEVKSQMHHSQLLLNLKQIKAVTNLTHKGGEWLVSKLLRGPSVMWMQVEGEGGLSSLSN